MLPSQPPCRPMRQLNRPRGQELAPHKVLPLSCHSKEYVVDRNPSPIRMRHRMDGAIRDMVRNMRTSKCMDMDRGRDRRDMRQGMTDAVLPKIRAQPRTNSSNGSRFWHFRRDCIGCMVPLRSWTCQERALNHPLRLHPRLSPAPPTNLFNS